MSKSFEAKKQTGVSDEIEEEIEALPNDEIKRRLTALKSMWVMAKSDHDRNTFDELSRRLTAVMIRRAATYEDFNEISFFAHNREDRKFAYMKTIELAPTKEWALGLYNHSGEFDEETTAAALRKLESFDPVAARIAHEHRITSERESKLNKLKLEERFRSHGS